MDLIRNFLKDPKPEDISSLPPDLLKIFIPPTKVDDIERERDSAMDELRSNFGGLAVSAAEQIIQRSLDENTHKDIIDNVLENAFTDKTEES